MAVQKKTVQLDASSKIQSVLEKTAKTLEKNKNDLLGAVNQANDAVAILTDIAEQVEIKKQELSELDSEYAVKLDEAQYDLRIKVRDNKENTVNELLREFGLAKISNSEIATLNQKVVLSERDTREEVETAVQKAKQEVAQMYEMELKEQESDYKVVSAVKDAKIGQLENTITVLDGQVADLKQSAKAELDARIRIAEAESNAQGVIINQGKKIIKHS